MDFKNEITKYVTLIDERIQKVTKLLKTCPRGTLQNGKYNKKPFLVRAIQVENKRMRVRVLPGTETCDGLIKKYILKAELKQLRANRYALCNLLKGYNDFSLSNAVSDLSNRFSLLDFDTIYNALKDHDKSAWENESFEQGSFMLNAKTHVTSRGLKVRSKSEALIAEKLYQYDLPFRYEQILHIDNFTFAPDFTIRRNDGKIFIWEHEGLTNEKAYLEKQLRKSQIYATAGIVPWDNFIVTYDNANGDIDLRIVESEIINKLVL